MTGFYAFQFARTLLSQSHLTPLPLHVSPVHWAYDYALSLYPIPDLVIIGDKYDPFTHQWKNTIVTNPVITWLTLFIVLFLFHLMMEFCRYKSLISHYIGIIS